jgi:hypothetical protein
MNKTLRNVFIVVVLGLLGFFIVNEFVLDEPIIENQVTVEDTTQKGN